MAKIDPGLKRLARAARQPAGAPRTLAVAAAPAGESDKANVMVELDGDTVPAGLLAIFEPRTRAGSVLTGAIPIPDIDKLETIPWVRRAERSRILKRELDK